MISKSYIGKFYFTAMVNFDLPQWITIWFLKVILVSFTLKPFALIDTLVT